MIVQNTSIDGVVALGSQVHRDQRGTTRRVFERLALDQAGIGADWGYALASDNPASGTLRGLHLQQPPWTETKVVTCVHGRVFDVAVDLRPGSSTFGQHLSMEMAAGQEWSVVIPPGVAHGFLTLCPDSVVLYVIAGEHMTEAETGVNWSDPELGIPWPIPPVTVSLRDQSLPTLAAWR